MKTNQKSLFIYRRDLRTEDNTALLSALNSSKIVYPIFVFTPEQIENNPYKSDFALRFMLESLEDLSQDIEQKGGKLSFFFGSVNSVIEKCIKMLGIDAVFVNRDYTPYSIERDKRIEKLCKNMGINFRSFDDLLLFPPESAVKADGSPYKVFTPFYRSLKEEDVAIPEKHSIWNFAKNEIGFAERPTLLSKLMPKDLGSLSIRGGRKEALSMLKKLKEYKNYAEERNHPYLDKTTHLSAHLKFTTISVRELFHAIEKALGPSSELLRALYWRDFFSHLAFFHPHVFGKAFYPKFDRLKWENNKETFKRWCEGKTGFPIVDAGMREMNQTGFMHNRLRMIVASFLVKDLHIDWRWGEKYFASTLIDYDPCVNNGNWQWAASTGCDAQPYFRIFNPWSQQQKFDPDCTYIKRWIPELKKISTKEIHTWYDQEPLKDYPSPILDHKTESTKTLNMFKSL